jgi:regulator of cell morphogenesis and NO signaling
MMTDWMGDTMTLGENTTVREIVASDYRAATVFHEFGIDFCCGGARTLSEACRAQDIDTEDVISELERAFAEREGSVPRFAEWESETLIGYIVGNHHAYVRKALPAILTHTAKLARSHGARHPELYEVAQRAETLAPVLMCHLEKEERVLFPYIGAVARAAREHRPLPPAPDRVFEMLEDEHQSAGESMAAIRALTGGYAVPSDGCPMYRICLRELEAFERDLHAHVHLENNLLFPRVRALVTVNEQSPVVAA